MAVFFCIANILDEQNHIYFFFMVQKLINYFKLIKKNKIINEAFCHFLTFLQNKFIKSYLTYTINYI